MSNNTSHPILAERTAITNILRFSSTLFYKYRIHFGSNGINEEAKRAVLAETLGFINTPFLTNGSCVYFTNVMQNHSIDTYSGGIPIKIFFTFVKKYTNLAQDRQLLQLLVERFIELEPMEFENEKLVCDLKVLNSVRNEENLLCIDFRFYCVKDDQWARKKWCPNGGKDTRVYFENQIYSVRLFSRKENILILKSNTGSVVSAPPNLCFEVDPVEEIPFGPSSIMIPITRLFACRQLEVWNLNFDGNLKIKVRILPSEKIKFGDGVECVPKNGNWVSTIRENEFFNPIELWSWCILYTEADFLDAHLLVKRMRKLPEETGISIGDPLYLQISDDIYSYDNAINSIVSKNLQIIIVFVPVGKNKPDDLIKYLCCVRNSIPFLIIRSAELVTSHEVHDVLLNINARLGGSPWTVDTSQFKSTMFCGSDYYTPKDVTKPKVCSWVANLSDDGFSWHSYSEIVNDNILSFLVAAIHDSMNKYRDINGRPPKRIVIYQRTEDHNHDELRLFYKQHFDVNSYGGIEVIVVFVRTNSQALFFRTANGVALNVPPGTVVNDALLTDDQDFYLVSKCSSSTEVIRPTHYSIVHNKCTLTSTDLLIMTYKMCHLDYALPRICEIPAPLSYARKLCVLITKFGVVPKSSNLNDLLYYL